MHTHFTYHVDIYIIQKVWGNPRGPRHLQPSAYLVTSLIAMGNDTKLNFKMYCKSELHVQYHNVTFYLKTKILACAQACPTVLVYTCTCTCTECVSQIRVCNLTCNLV